MIKKTLCLLAFLAMMGCNDFELLSQMADYEFGKTVIQTIQIELSAGE